MNVKELQARYPFVVLEDTDNGIKVICKLMSFNVGKDDEQAEAIIALENLKAAKESLLSATFPYLYFSVYQVIHQLAHVWISRFYGSELRDGASTGFSFAYPPDETANQKLTELNEQAKLSSQDGMFFCTKCQTAKPKAEYGGYWFAEQRCLVCADEKWKKEAARETYD